MTPPLSTRSRGPQGLAHQRCPADEGDDGRRMSVDNGERSPPLDVHSYHSGRTRLLTGKAPCVVPDSTMVEEPFDATAFTHNRERLIKHAVARRFFDAVVAPARAENLLSSDHFSVDGTLIEAWGSAKSFRPKEGDTQDNAGFVNFKGEKRTNDTHESKTDPDARLARKGNGREARLSHMGHVLVENRNGLVTLGKCPRNRTTFGRPFELSLRHPPLTALVRLSLSLSLEYSLRAAHAALRIARRVVMRLFSVALSDSQPYAILALAGEGGSVPRQARRLRITVWWTETNTGQGEDKAEIFAWLSDASGAWLQHQAGRNHVIRFDFDCYDPDMLPCPTGELKLWLYAEAVPTEERHLRRDYRTLYVSWFWESGPDLSLIDCGVELQDLCDPVAPDLDGVLAPAWVPECCQ